MCKKEQNTVLGYKKRSKSKSEKSDRSGTQKLWVVSLYSFWYKSIWIDLKEKLDFSLHFRLFCVKKGQNTVLDYKKGSKSKSEKSDRSGTQKLWVVSLYDLEVKNVLKIFLRVL